MLLFCQYIHLILEPQVRRNASYFIEGVDSPFLQLLWILSKWKIYLSPDLAMIVKFRFVIAETPEGSVKTSNIVNLHVRTFKGRLLFTTQFDLSFSTTSTSPIKVDDG